MLENLEHYYQGIMLIVTRLGNQDRMLPSCSFDKVVSSYVCHNLSSRIDFGMKLLLQFPEGL